MEKYITERFHDVELLDDGWIIYLKTEEDVEKFIDLKDTVYADDLEFRGFLEVDGPGKVDITGKESFVKKLADKKSIPLNINKKDGKVSGNTILGQEIEYGKVDLETVLKNIIPLFGKLRIKILAKRTISYAIYSSSYELKVDFDDLKCVVFRLATNSLKTIFFKERSSFTKKLDQKVGCASVFSASMIKKEREVDNDFHYFSMDKEADEFLRNNLPELCKTFKENHGEFRFSFKDPDLALVFENMLQRYEVFRNLKLVRLTTEGTNVRAIGIPENFDEQAISFLINKFIPNTQMHIRFFYPEEEEVWLEQRKVFIFVLEDENEDNDNDSYECPLIATKDLFHFEDIIVQFIKADCDYDENSRPNWSYLIPKEKIRQLAKIRDSMGDKITVAYDYGKYINIEFNKLPNQEFTKRYPILQQPQLMKLRGFPDTTPIPVLYKLFEKYGVINIKRREGDDEFKFTLEVATLDDREDLLKSFSKNVEIDEPEKDLN